MLIRFSTQNWIDFISIVPYFIWIVMLNFDFSSNQKNILRTLKILVVFKITRFSESIKSFGLLITSAKKELVILFVYLTVGIVFYSTILYYSEKDEPLTRFTSIPATFW